MTFEEEELGGKSVGVQPSAPAAAGGGGDGGEAGHHYDGQSYGARRGGHVRESLPPAFVSTQSHTVGGDVLPMSAGGMEMRVMGDSGQEMEIRDAAGRYRHARRAPVDEMTLQPLRRVSKAGLESSAYNSLEAD